jgi:peptide/nickel transport system substrate-binding protein
VSPSGAAKPAPTEAGQPTRGGTLRVGLWQEPDNLNRYFSTQTVNRIVVFTVVEGLTRGGPEGSYVPVLAEELPTPQNGGVSADGRTITWKLKKDVTWSDGQPFTSDDVVFTYKMLMDPANPVATRTDYAIMDSVTATDPATVVVTYKNVNAAYRVAFPAILPAHVFNNQTNIDKHPYNRAPIGTGPFVFKAWASGDTITFERNPKYREPNKPSLDGVIYKITPSREASVQAFKVGDIDVLWNLIESNIPEFEAMKDANIDPRPSPGIERLHLNISCSSGPQQGDPTCPHPMLGDVRVRQAIELGIDKQALVDNLLLGKAKVATSSIVGFFSPELPPSEFSPDKARQLLETAGWQVGSDGVRTKAGVRAHLAISSTTGDVLREQAEQLIQEQMKTIGIELEVKNATSPVLLGTWAGNGLTARGNMDIGMYTTQIAIDPQTGLTAYISDQVPNERTPSGGNIWRLQDPEIDSQVRAAGTILDDQARKAAYKSIAERLAGDKVVIPLYSRLSIDAKKNYVQGWQTNVWDFLSWNSQDWWLKK